METKLDTGFKNILNLLRSFGKNYLRPAGLDAERSGEPLPVDHKLFMDFNKLGWSFSNLGGSRSKKQSSDKPKGPKRTSRMSVLAAEELAFWDQGAAMSLPGPGLGGPPVSLLGTPEQKERFLYAPFKDKSKPAWGAYATTEPGAGSDVARIRCTAVRDGEHYILNGEKMYITNGARASWVVIFASIDLEAGRSGHRPFVVEKGTPGFSVSRIEKKMGLTSSETAGLSLEDCRVPVANLLGQEKKSDKNQGFKAAMATFDQTRPLVAAMSVGIGRCAWERARDIAKEAFGKTPHSSKEILMLQRLAEARRQLDAARLLCWEAAWKLDHGENNTKEASMSKIFAPRAGMFATQVAMDIASLAGVRQDMIIEKCFRDEKIFDIFEGTGEIQRIVLARRLLGFPSR